MKKVVLGVFEVRTISVLSPDWKLVSQAEGKNRRAFSGLVHFLATHPQQDYCQHLQSKEKRSGHALSDRPWSG